MPISKDIFINDLDKLVGFQTLTGDEKGFSEAMAFIMSQIHGSAHVDHIKNNGVDILVAGSQNTKSPDVVFLTHVDVVSAQPHQFKMKQREGKLFGRGVSDMKYSIRRPTRRICSHPPTYAGGIPARLKK